MKACLCIVIKLLGCFYCLESDETLIEDFNTLKSFTGHLQLILTGRSYRIENHNSYCYCIILFCVVKQPPNQPDWSLLKEFAFLNLNGLIGISKWTSVDLWSKCSHVEQVLTDSVWLLGRWQLWPTSMCIRKASSRRMVRACSRLVFHTGWILQLTGHFRDHYIIMKN